MNIVQILFPNDVPFRQLSENQIRSFRNRPPFFLSLINNCTVDVRRIFRALVSILCQAKIYGYEPTEIRRNELSFWCLD